MNIKRAKDMSGQKKKSAIIYNCLIVFFCCVFLICAYMLISYFWQEWRNESQNSDIASDVIILPDETQADETASDTSSVAEQGYRFAPIPESIDFNKLKNKNEDVVGWLFNQNGVVNYPILQGDDNDYYLTHTINKKKNVNGSIFMDYRNSSDYTDSITMIYGHNMKNGTMFATIRRYRNQSYYEAYPSFYLYTEQGNFRLDVFSAYQTTVYDTVFSTSCNVEDKSQLISHAFSKSAIKADVSVGNDDNIIILSTCTGRDDDARFAVLCKIVSIENS